MAIRHDMIALPIRWILSIGVLGVLALVSTPAHAQGSDGGAAQGIVLPEGPPELRGETIERIQKNRQQSQEKSQADRRDAMRRRDGSNDATGNENGEARLRNRYRYGR
jgi:hypothetical protein